MCLRGPSWGDEIDGLLSTLKISDNNIFRWQIRKRLDCNLRTEATVDLIDTVDPSMRMGVALLMSLVFGDKQLERTLLERGAILSGSLWEEFLEYPAVAQYVLQHQPQLLGHRSVYEKMTGTGKIYYWAKVLRFAALTENIAFLDFAAHHRKLKKHMASLSDGAYTDQVVSFLRTVNVPCEIESDQHVEAFFVSTQSDSFLRGSPIINPTVSVEVFKNKG